MSDQKKIYLADDEASIRSAIKKFLENEGYYVEDYETGDLLMQNFLIHPADLVILDVMMPGSNGFVICRELRKITRIPIIMLTARDSDLDYMTGMSLGSDDYFTKPFSPMSLVLRVKAIFRRLELDRLTFEESATGSLTGEQLQKGAAGAGDITGEQLQKGAAGAGGITDEQLLFDPAGASGTDSLTDEHLPNDPAGAGGITGEQLQKGVEFNEKTPEEQHTD